MLTFQKKISKGSRFNQIYVPKNLEKELGVGDLVEVRLIKKHIELHYSKGLNKLSEFKENLIRDMFSFLNTSNIFVVGSFLLKDIDYNDIDVIIISNKEIDVYSKLIKKFNLKFHVLQIDKKKLEYLLHSCPLTRSMFNNYVCNKEVKLDFKKVIDKKHIKFLLMMPEDLLEIQLNSKAYYDSIRRLITIERFLDDKNSNNEEIDKELNGLMKERLLKRIKSNEEISDENIIELRVIIKEKIKEILKFLK